MAVSFRAIRTGVLTAGLVGLLAGCSNGHGGLRLFFGMNGDGSCNSVTIDVDLAAAGAVLQRLPDDAVDCTLSTLLGDAGCDVSFSEIDSGNTLRATISGCTIPAISSLFVCGFSEADLSTLQGESNAQCTCKSAGCDTTPPLCVGQDSDPASCEDCSNNKDDDGNGFVDCADPNCEHSPDCAAVTTTTLNVTTTTLGETTTTAPVTTTTVPTTQECTFRFHLNDAVTAGSLQWDTSYTAADGTLRGTGAGVACTSLASGALAAFSDNDAAKKLSSGLISLDGIVGPTDLAECTFDATGPISVGDFVVSVTEASTPDLVDITPLPVIAVTDLNCVGTTTTTTTGPVTTTTTAPVTTTTMGGGGGGAYTVLFKLTSASSTVGALQFTADYSGAPGAFDGAGAGVACTSKVSGALFAPNDNEATKKLTMGLIALTAFSAPTDLVSCSFTATSTPVPADIGVTIDDATDGDGAPITAAIAVTITPAP